MVMRSGRHRTAGPDSLASKIIDEILEYGQVFDRHIFELDPAASRADLFPGSLGHFIVIHNSALNLVQVNETVVAAEYFYVGAPLIILLCRQIPDAQPTHADILDLPHVNEFIGSYEGSECTFFALEPFESSFFFKHFFPPNPKEGNPTIETGKSPEGQSIY